MCFPLQTCNLFRKSPRRIIKPRPYVHISSPSMSPDYHPNLEDISIEQIKEVTDNFGENNRLDSPYKRVYYGVLRNGTEEETKVAFKKIVPYDNHDVQQFLSQVSTISRFKHDNIIRIIGYCVSGDLWILATEYANSRSLYDSLHGQSGIKPEQVLAWTHRVKIAYGVAKALEYLHETLEQPMRHGNIKSTNVLLFTSDVGNELNAKLSEISPPTNNVLGSTIRSNDLGSFGYTDPKHLETGRLTVKSDIYSFGIILLELLTGQKPIDSSLEKEKHSLVIWCQPRLKRRVHEIMDPRLESNYCQKTAKKIAAIAALCVQFDAAKRPKTGDIVTAISSLLN